MINDVINEIRKKYIIMNVSNWGLCIRIMLINIYFKYLYIIWYELKERCHVTNMQIFLKFKNEFNKTKKLSHMN